MDADALHDALLDLEHDLGKYILLPLGMLPADADAKALRVALQRGLHETRRGADGTRSAAQVWTAFADQVGPDLRARGLWVELVACVERALRWSDASVAVSDRAAILADLQAVAPAIRAVARQLVQNPATPSR